MILRTGPTITSQKRVKDETVYKPHFSPEFGGFSLEKEGGLGYALAPEQSSQTCPILRCDGWSTSKIG